MGQWILRAAGGLGLHAQSLAQTIRKQAEFCPRSSSTFCTLSKRLTGCSRALQIEPLSRAVLSPNCFGNSELADLGLLGGPLAAFMPQNG